MKIFVNTLVAIIIVAVVAFKIFGNGLFTEEFSVSCSDLYSTENNENLITCTVIDPNDLISEDYPLVISLIDSDTNIVSESNLVVGETSIILDELEFSSQYTIEVSGYELNNDVYAPKEYYTHTFSTVNDDFILPIVSKTDLIVTDTTVSFDLILTDSLNLISSISITISDDGTLIHTINLIEFSNLSILFDSLDELTEYQIDINVTYKINDFDTLTTVLHTFTDETLKTPDIPEASVSIVSNDNVNLVFNVTTSDMDATSALYSVVLIDDFDNVLHSENLTSTSVTIDISLITVDYQISILSSYTLSDTDFTDVEITTYNITTNEYSNFFSIPDLNIIDITVPLDNYNDYDDYLYTNYNEGNSEFRIECVATLDCTTLVNTEPYSSFPFQIIGLVHSFYDTKNISYSVTTSYVDITIHYVYTPAEIALITAEVNNIINLVTTNEMTTSEKILAVHDYVVNNAVYDQECYLTPATCDNDHDAYGILFDGNAVCEGYAHAMDIALRAMRIPSFRISSELHQWNGVYVDGSWVHLDATWDDPVSSGGENTLSHKYFLITSTELASFDLTESHTYDQTYVSFID